MLFNRRTSLLSFPSSSFGVPNEWLSNRIHFVVVEAIVQASIIFIVEAYIAIGTLVRFCYALGGHNELGVVWFDWIVSEVDEVDGVVDEACKNRLFMQQMSANQSSNFSSWLWMELKDGV